MTRSARRVRAFRAAKVPNIAMNAESRFRKNAVWRCPACGLAEREKAACSLARLLARRGAARMHLKEYKSAHEDCQAAAGLYGEVGQMKQAQALEADLVKLAAFLPNE